MKKESKKRLNLGDIIRKVNARHDESDSPKKLTFTLDSKPDRSSKREVTEHGQTSSAPTSETITTTQVNPIEESHQKQMPTMVHATTMSTHSQAPVPPVGLSLQTESTSTGDADDEEEFDLFKYLHIVMRRKEIVVLCAILVGAFSIFSFLRSTKFFKARARLLFRPHTNVLIGNQNNIRYYGDREKNFNTHLELLKSNIVLERVSQNLESKLQSGAIKAGLKIKRGQTDGESNNIIELDYKNVDAENARDVLNELCRTYIEYRREVNAQEETRLLFKLETQIDKLQTDLTNKEDRLRNFKENHSMIHLSKDVNLIVNKLADMEIKYQETQLALLENKERLTTLKSHISQQEINVVQSMTYENPTHKKLAELELELNTLMGEYSSDHFRVKQITTQIENLKKAMQGEIQKEITEKAVSRTLIKNPIRQSLLENYVNLNIQISSLEVKRIAQEQIIEKLNQEMTKLPSLEQEYAYLQRQTESLLKTMQMLKMKLEETKIRRDSKESELKILELAKTPKVAIASKKPSSIIIGFFIGIIIGIALAFFLEYLDQTVKEPTDIEKMLETPLLGIVPLIEADNAIVKSEELAKSVLEPFRTLRTNIKYIASQHQSKLFMICSAVKGEGKTTLAINLAITFAMDGKKVLLVDCDLRRSQIHTLLSVPKKTGLTDYLTGQKGLEDIVKTTIQEDLFVITSGDRPNNPAELLGTPKFNEFLAEARTSFDIIIIDSPALIPVSDTIAMAPYMDCCIMIARALWTPLKAAKQAKSQLSRIGANIIGGVLNGITHSRGYYPYYYGYYGYYAYKYSYDYDEQPKKRFSLREIGNTIESSIKSSFQHVGMILPRYFGILGNTVRRLLSKLTFWILILTLLTLIGIRYYIAPLGTKSNKPLITYLGTTSDTNKSPAHPVTIVPSTQKVNRLETDSKFAYYDSLYAWRQAYNNGDTLRFFQFYDQSSFTFTDGNFVEWHILKNSELTSEIDKPTLHSIDNLHAESLNENMVTLTFTAIHKQEKDTTKSQITLSWVYNKEQWRIVKEEYVEVR